MNKKRKRDNATDTPIEQDEEAVKQKTRRGKKEIPNAGITEMKK